jgi:hypothetical protein
VEGMGGDVDLKSIENIINQIDDEMIETEEAVKQLKSATAYRNGNSASQGLPVATTLSKSKVLQDSF